MDRIPGILGWVPGTRSMIKNFTWFLIFYGASVYLSISSSSTALTFLLLTTTILNEFFWMLKNHLNFPPFLTISSSIFSLLTFTNTKGQQEPLVRRSSQPKKSPVAAEASPEAVGSPPGAAASIAGAAAVASPSPPVTSPEVGTDSEAGKGNFRRRKKNEVYSHDQELTRCAFLRLIYIDY